ncbi:MAG: efflux RND transporter periplasmic adaptor subunit, partial [Bacteroidota bacterium]
MKNYLSILATIFILTACGGGGEEVAQQAVYRPVKYAKVTNSSAHTVRSFTGIAQSEKEAKLSFRVAGTVRSLNVKLGDRVRQGQVIATIDPSDYSIQADQAVASQKGAEANLKSSENQLIIARSNYQRIEKLYENNSVPLSEFEQAKSNFETAQSQYEAAQTQVTSAEKQSQSARNQVKYTQLVAPFSGIISMVMIEANEIVGSGSPIATLSAITKPEVNVGIPENLIAQIKKGQKVNIRFSVLPNASYQGTVQEVSYAAGNSPTYPVIIGIDNPNETIRPGMAATVSFDLDGGNTPDALVCPVKAVGSDEKGN